MENLAKTAKSTSLPLRRSRNLRRAVQGDYISYYDTANSLHENVLIAELARGWDYEGTLNAPARWMAKNCPL